MKQIQLEPKHLEIVVSILKNFDHDYFIFGSRAKGTARPLSDLDLLIKDNVDKKDLFLLREAFENSNLPFKVDLVAWEQIDDSFRSHIEQDLVPLTNKLNSN